MYWKKIAINMYIALYTLFVGTVAWDFYLTLVTTSLRSTTLHILPSGISAFIIFSWLGAVLILSFMLMFFIFTKDQYAIPPYITFPYVLIMCVYGALFVLAILTPAIPIPLAVNYLVNAVWAAILIYFTHEIRLALLKKQPNPTKQQLA